MRRPTITQVDTPQSCCRFALAWCDITPPVGIYHRMWGAASHDRATGVHRPLRATAAVFAPAETRAPGSTETDNESLVNTPRRLELEQGQILVALDHCVLGAVEHDELVTHIAQVSGQPKETILVVFSHTHAAGLMGLERVALPGGDLIPGYLRSVATRAAALVKQCALRLEPAGIVYGHGHCALAAHRDFFDEQRKQFVCGFNPGEPADDTLLVARLTDDSGKLLATVVNYACHPTTLAWDNTLISPDYVSALRDVVEQATGAPCLFLQGASGELGPREGYVGDTSVADRNGRQVGFAALSTITALPAAGTQFRYNGPVVSGAALGTWAHEPLPSSEVKRTKVWQHWRWREPLPYRPGQPSVAQVQTELMLLQVEEDTARTAGDAERAAEFRAMVERKRRLLHRLSQLPLGDTFPLQVVLWRMGDAFWIGVQGESYSLLQKELRRRFAGTPIVVASVAADWGASYLPTAQIYGTGIYQESIAVVAPGSLEQLIESIAARIEAGIKIENTQITNSQ